MHTHSHQKVPDSFPLNFPKKPFGVRIWKNFSSESPASSQLLFSHTSNNKTALHNCRAALAMGRFSGDFHVACGRSWEQRQLQQSCAQLMIIHSYGPQNLSQQSHSGACSSLTNSSYFTRFSSF